MKKIISTVVSGLLVLHLSAYAEQINLNGQRVDASQWINKEIFTEQLQAILAQSLEGSEYFGPVQAAQKMTVALVGKQKTAQESGHAVVKLIALPPKPVIVDTGWTSNHIAVTCVGSVLLGVLIGWALK